MWNLVFIWTCPCKELTSVAEDAVLCYGTLKGGRASLWQSMKWIHELSVFRYLKFTLDQYVESDYTLVYLHHGLTSENKPSLSWLRDAYREFDRKWVGDSRQGAACCSVVSYRRSFPFFASSLVIISYYCLFLLLVEVGFCLLQAESWNAQLLLKLHFLGQQVRSRTRNQCKCVSSVV